MDIIKKGKDPIGVAKRKIKKGEYIEILILPNGFMYSDAIDFSNKGIK